jgi:hypothetical protein
LKPGRFFLVPVGALALALSLGPVQLLAADDRTEARAHAAKAQALLTKGDAAQARSEAFQAAGLDEENAKAWWVLGQAEKALGHKDKARKAVEHALELDAEGKDLDRKEAQALLQDLISSGAKAVPRGSGVEAQTMAAFAQYVDERDRQDRVVGQGSSVLAEHGGDRTEAERTAKRQALASLAEAMQTRITVITQASDSSDKPDSEVSSSTREESRALLRDVETRRFEDFPLPGRVTVLAWMDRERYLDLLSDQKILQRSTGWGIAARLGGIVLSGLDSSQGPCLRWGGELSYGAWTLGGFALNGPFVENAALYTGVLQSNTWSQGHLNGWGLEGGWDWIAAHPWKRLQLYAPLRLQVLSLTLSAEPQGQVPSGSPPSIMLDGARAGIGCRWWGSDIFALDMRATYGLGLNQAQLSDADGQPFYLRGKPIGLLGEGGPEFTASVRIGWL